MDRRSYPGIIDSSFFEQPYALRQARYRYDGSRSSLITGNDVYLTNFFGESLDEVFRHIQERYGR